MVHALAFCPLDWKLTLKGWDFSCGPMLTVRLRPCNLQLWGFQTPTLSSVGSPYRPYHQTWVPGLTLDPPTPVGQCLEAFCALQDWRVPRGPPFPPNWPLIPLSSLQTLAKMYPLTNDPRIPLEVPQLSAFYWLEEGTLPILWS